MRIICENGFYKFFPEKIAEVKRFQTKFGVELVECEDYFTFPVLAALPNYSFIGHVYSGVIVGLANYAGKREEVMAANGLTYHIGLKRLILRASFSGFTKLDYVVSNYIFTNTLPQAYFYDNNGLITGFNGFVDVDFMKFKIERFFYPET